MWNCQNCSKPNEDSFEICWSCGASKDGEVDPTFQQAEDPQFDINRWKSGRETAPQFPKRADDISSHLFVSLLVFLCCCPVAIVAIVFGVQVLWRLDMGDNKGAYYASKSALTWVIISIVLGVFYYYIRIKSPNDQLFNYLW